MWDRNTFLSFLSSRQFAVGALGISLCLVVRKKTKVFENVCWKTVVYAYTASQKRLNLASSVGCQRDAICICWWAPASAVRRSQLSIERSAANPPYADAAVNRRNRQRDRRTDARPLHKPCSTYYAGSVNNKTVIDQNSGLFARSDATVLRHCQLVDRKKIRTLEAHSNYSQRFSYEGRCY